LLKFQRGLETGTSTEQQLAKSQATEQIEHAIVRRLVSKEDIAHATQPHTSMRTGGAYAFFTSSSQCQRTQNSVAKVQISKQTTYFDI
jgi:hypothetical protein